MGREVDFFVSYTAADERWATWIAWQLEQAGLSVVIQAWDFLAGGNFVALMDEAIQRSDRVLVVLSERYLQSRFGAEEWRAKFAERPSAVVPVRVDDVQPVGLLGPMIYVDLFDKDEATAAAELRRHLVDGGRPTSSPVFPGVASTAAAGSGAVVFPANRVFANVPERRAFVGRVEELDRLAESSDTATVVCQVAAGMGGVGKTALLLEYAHRNRSARAWVGWATGGTRPQLLEGIAALAPDSACNDSETQRPQHSPP